MRPLSRVVGMQTLPLYWVAARVILGSAVLVDFVRVGGVVIGISSPGAGAVLERHCQDVLVYDMTKSSLTTNASLGEP
jgi:hypothetical protein